MKPRVFTTPCLVLWSRWLSAAGGGGCGVVMGFRVAGIGDKPRGSVSAGCVRDGYCFSVVLLFRSNTRTVSPRVVSRIADGVAGVFRSARTNSWVQARGSHLSGGFSE